MGRDILDFTSEVPEERLGLPPEDRRNEGGNSQTDWSTPEAIGDPEPTVPLVAADPGRRTSQASPVGRSSEPPTGRGLYNLITVGVGLVIAAAVGYYFWLTAGRAEIAVDGADIANAEQVLSEAEDRMRAVAEADGAPLAQDASCHFAPGSNADQPAVLCGPVWLGVSPDDQPWLEVRVSYRTDGSDGQRSVVGEVDEVSGTAAGDPADFVRPDGRSALRPDQPSRSTSGPRLGGGELVLAPSDMLAEAEAFLADALANPDPDAAALTAAEDWKCFLMELPNQLHGRSVADSSAWCGPLRTAGSLADQVWLPVGLGWQNGPTFGTRIVEEARSIGRLQALPEDAVLTRPDGATPADIDGVDRPPVAADFAETFDYQLPLEPLDRSGETPVGVLATDRNRLQFDGLARTKKIGSGARSVTAPDGHDLVVATITAAEEAVQMAGVLLIDGTNERPLPRWPSLDEGASLVVVVPEQATAVDLVIDNDGRPQTISLLDGTLAPGYPLALYRPAVEPGSSLFSRVAMPAGDPVEIEGVVSRLRWSAQDEESAWLPTGTSDLLVEIDEWDVDRPCCEVRIDDVALSATLLDSEPNDSEPNDSEPNDNEPDDGGSGVPAIEYEDLRSEPAESPRPFDPLRFRVPEDLTAATLRITVTFSVVHDEQTETITEVLEVDLALP